VRTDREYDIETGYLARIYSQQEGLFGLLSSIEGNGPVQDMTVAFDAIGNLIHRSDLGNGFTENYDYDVLNRLTNAYSDYGNGNTLQRRTSATTHSVTSPTRAVLAVTCTEHRKATAVVPPARMRSRASHRSTAVIARRRVTATTPTAI